MIDTMKLALTLNGSKTELGVREKFAEQAACDRVLMGNASLSFFNEDEMLVPVVGADWLLQLELAAIKTASRDGKLLFIEAYLAEDCCQLAKKTRELGEPGIILDGSALQEGVYVTMLYDGQTGTGHLLSYCDLGQDNDNPGRIHALRVPVNMKAWKVGMRAVREVTLKPIEMIDLLEILEVKPKAKTPPTPPTAEPLGPPQPPKQDDAEAGDSGSASPDRIDPSRFG